MAPPHPGVVGGEVSVEEDSPDLHLLWLRQSQPLPLASTNQPLHVAPPQSATLAEAAGGPHLLWHHVVGSLLLARVLSLW